MPSSSVLPSGATIRHLRLQVDSLTDHITGAVLRDQAQNLAVADDCMSEVTAHTLLLADTTVQACLREGSGSDGILACKS